MLLAKEPSRGCRDSEPPGCSLLLPDGLNPRHAPDQGLAAGVHRMAAQHQRMVVRHGAAQQEAARFESLHGHGAFTGLQHDQLRSDRLPLHSRLAAIDEQSGHGVTAGRLDTPAFPGRQRHIEIEQR